MINKIFFLYLFINSLFFIYTEDQINNSIKDNTTDFIEIVIPDDIKTNKKKDYIKNSKIFTSEVMLKLDVFNKYKDGWDFYNQFFDKYFSGSFYFYDLALARDPNWNLMAYLSFPYLEFHVLNHSLWDGKIFFNIKLSSLLLYMGNLKDLDDNDKTDENFYGYYIMPEFSFKINPIDNLFFYIGYMGIGELYHDDDLYNKKFIIKPNIYVNNPFAGIIFDKLFDTSGIKVNLNADFYITDKDYYWGYLKEKKAKYTVDQFCFTITQKNIFRIPLIVLNESYFEFNIDVYYSYKRERLFGNTKLNLDKYVPYYIWMNGYNDREISLYKGIKGRFLSNINFFSKEYIIKDEKSKSTSPDLIRLNMDILISYDILFFNSHKDPDEFYLENNIINGFCLGYRVKIMPIYKLYYNEYYIDFNISYGFDLYEYEKRINRLMFTLGFLCKTIL